MKIYDIIIILGITSIVLLTSTFIFGFFKINIKNRIFIHKILAILTFIVALIHASIVIYINYFMK